MKTTNANDTGGVQLDRSASGESCEDSALWEWEPGAVEWIDRRFPVFFIVLGLIAIVGVTTAPGDEPSTIAVLLVLVALGPWTLSLVGVRAPDWVFAVVVILPVGFLYVLGDPLGLVDLSGGTPQVVLMLVLGVVGQLAAVGRRFLAWAAAICAGGVILAGALVRGALLDQTPWIIGLILTVGGATAFRRSVEYFHRLRVAEEDLAAQRVSDERRRIAREVHDIVAHTMSVTMLHVTAARMSVRRDPDAAEEALAEAERHGRASMDEIRQVVRLLRSDESALDGALPDDADLPALVDGYRAAGSEVRLTLRGGVSDLAAARRLAVYRIVQEALSNAARHGEGPIDVSVDNGDEGTVIEVVNRVDASRPLGSGSGLAGMRERVEALDGGFSAGADDGVWRVDARIPR